MRDELKSRLEAAPQPLLRAAVALQAAATEAVIDLPMYQIDPVLRRSAPLQRTRDGRAGPRLYGGTGVNRLVDLWGQLPGYVHSTVFTLVLTVVLILSSRT